MLNRRILRIKVFQALYAYNREEQPVTSRFEKFLLDSVEAVEEMYYLILGLPVEIRYYIENYANPEEVKYLPNQRDIASGRTFIYNQVIEQLQTSEFLLSKLKKVKHNWQENRDLLRILFQDFKSGEYFQKYLDEPVKDFNAQKKLMLDFFEHFLGNSEDFDQYMEELYMHWQDDKKMVLKQLSKTIEMVTEVNNGRNFVMNLSDNWDEDWGFARDLFRRVVLHGEEYTAMISGKTEKWDTERIAVADMLLMQMALCEMIEFESIPVKVTINEYLEIAKLYSTPKSNTFLNGVLDKIKNDLKAQNKIVKQGRGLVE